jgi:hypothetical protein
MLTEDGDGPGVVRKPKPEAEKQLLEDSVEWRALILAAYPDSEVLSYYQDEHMRLLLLQAQELLVFGEDRHVVQGFSTQVFDGRDYVQGQTVQPREVLPAETATKLLHLWITKFPPSIGNPSKCNTRSARICPRKC